MAQKRPAAPPAPDMVGNAFVENYYCILYNARDQLHKFYQDSSCLSRPGADGSMTSATTIQGINELLLSLDDDDHVLEILTVDSQSSYQDGFIVFVTGFSSGKDMIKRKFTQTFYLVPQNNGYFVLNDILRYVDNHGSAAIATYDHKSICVANGDIIEDVQVTDHSTENHTSLPEENVNNGDIANRELENIETSVPEKAVEIADPLHNSIPSVVAENNSPVVKQDAPKKSYASLVHALKENPAPFQSKVLPKPTKPLRSAPTSEAVARAPAPAPAPASNRNKYAERSNNHSVTGHSVFIRNLPFDAAAEQLAEVFKNFGPIKPNGIQVRGFKEQQSCFGFVEFESLSSMQSAIQASPVTIGNRKATVEMKRKDNNDNFKPRGAFQNGNFSPRGGDGGRGNGRREFEKRGDYSGRGRGNGNGGGYNGRNSSNGNGDSNGTAPQTVKN